VFWIDQEEVQHPDLTADSLVIMVGTKEVHMINNTVMVQVTQTRVMRDTEDFTNQIKKYGR
jgi:hypothetical protein